LTKFGYAHNAFDPEFIEGMTKEIELNKQIVDKIFPQLIDQENDAREKRPSVKVPKNKAKRRSKGGVKSPTSPGKKRKLKL